MYFPWSELGSDLNLSELLIDSHLVPIEQPISFIPMDLLIFLLISVLFIPLVGILEDFPLHVARVLSDRMPLAVYAFETSCLGCPANDVDQQHLSGSAEVVIEYKCWSVEIFQLVVGAAESCRQF